MGIGVPRYETDQLLSLIGSKRAIQQPLRFIISELFTTCHSLLFLDPFCGSGSVSRLARSLGLRVIASDTQPFLFVVNSVYLGLNNDDLAFLFPTMGGLDAYFSYLNMLGLYAAQTTEGIGEGYLSRYYAPRDDANYDGMRERLFFTQANARFLDAVRREIEQSRLDGQISEQEKLVVLASLISEASRRANTLGSFTAFHKRFATREKPVRARITTPCMLQPPLLVEQNVPRGEMYCEEASLFVKRYRADICYLDPPATVRQYGSSYHLLNSIALWDHMVPSDERDAEGKLLDHAGIRSDWKQTASPFCSLKHADKALVHLLDCVDARYIVLTYPTSGIISSERIRELLSARHAPVQVIPLFKRKQGGRQKKSGTKETIEQVFVAGKKETLSLCGEDSMEKLKACKRLDELSSSIFRHASDSGPFHFIGGVILATFPQADVLLHYSAQQLHAFADDMEKNRCASYEEAVKTLAEALAGTDRQVHGVGRSYIEKRLFSLLRRMQEEKESKEVVHCIEMARALVSQTGGMKLLDRRLSEFSERIR